MGEPRCTENTHRYTDCECKVARLKALNAELALAVRGLLTVRSVAILEEAAREYPHGKEDVIDEVGAFDFARAALAKHKEAS